VVEREYLVDIAAVVARAQELKLPSDIGGGQGRLRTARLASGWANRLEGRLPSLYQKYVD
jgi:hypothetical protein